MLKTNHIEINEAYNQLYLRPLNEIRFQGYICQNIELTEHGLAYIKITDSILNQYGVDAATPGNMINDLNYVDEIIVWVIFTEDVKNDNIRVSIRSRGPVINDLASNYNGGGHIYASGARITKFEEADKMIKELDDLCDAYS